MGMNPKKNRKDRHGEGNSHDGAVAKPLNTESSLTYDTTWRGIAETWIGISSRCQGVEFEFVRIKGRAR
jgi:hypothetical protein